MHLIGIVVGQRSKNDVQSHVEVAIVDWPRQRVAQFAHAEKNLAGMARKVLFINFAIKFFRRFGTDPQNAVDNSAVNSDIKFLQRKQAAGFRF